MKKFLVMSCLVLLLGTTFLSAQSSKARSSRPSIYEVAKTTPGFEILAAALDAAGVAEAFDGHRHFTVFAPTNEAFEQLLNDLGWTAEELLGDKDLLTAVLFYHVTRGDRNAASVVAAGSLRMLDGNPASIWTDNGQAYINDSKIVQTDIRARNGLIHVIDRVLLPPAE
jgi:uncharacterized surface protein with fasciclin (FAS1) repeats